MLRLHLYSLPSPFIRLEELVRIAGGHSTRASGVTTRAAQLMALLARRPSPPDVDRDRGRGQEESVARLRQAGAVPVLETIIADADYSLRFASCHHSFF